METYLMLLTHHPSHLSYFMSMGTYVALYQAASVGSFGSIAVDTPSRWYYFMGIFLHPVVTLIALYMPMHQNRAPASRFLLGGWIHFDPAGPLMRQRYGILFPTITSRFTTKLVSLSFSTARQFICFSLFCFTI